MGKGKVHKKGRKMEGDKKKTTSHKSLSSSTKKI
jgi:hypothetical protein